MSISLHGSELRMRYPAVEKEAMAMIEAKPGVPFMSCPMYTWSRKTRKSLHQNELCWTCWKYLHSVIVIWSNKCAKMVPASISVDPSSLDDTSSSRQTNWSTCSVQRNRRGLGNRQQHSGQTQVQEAQRKQNTTQGAQNTQQLGIQCGNCGRSHGPKETCPAKGKTCNFCKKTGHFLQVCRSRKTNQPIHDIQDHTEQDNPYYDALLFENIHVKSVTHEKSPVSKKEIHATVNIDIPFNNERRSESKARHRRTRQRPPVTIL